MCFTPRGCALRDGYDGEFYVVTRSKEKRRNGKEGGEEGMKRGREGSGERERRHIHYKLEEVRRTPRAMGTVSMQKHLECGEPGASL